MELTMKERQSLATVTAPRYRKANKSRKTEILNEFCQNTGYNRKYAISVLTHVGKKQLRFLNGKTVSVLLVQKKQRTRVYTPYYDEDVKHAVIRLWNFFHFICGQRLVPLIRENLSAIASSHRFGINETIQKKLATISRSTVERILRTERKKHKKGSCTTKPGTLLKQQIPVRTFWHWDDKQPGFCEIDTVSHDGGFIDGSFLYTLSVTDVCTGWSEFRALKNKAQVWTESALDDVRCSFPLPLKGIDSDNGSEFINWHLARWCEKHHITFTRGRQYRKNDNAYVEQKNGDVVRKTVGYGRFDNDDALAALAEVYAALSLLHNFFYPNLKCVDKLRIGQRVKRIYEPDGPKTPFQRIMSLSDIGQSFKVRLAMKKKSLNIIQLQDSVDRAIDTLMLFVHHSPGGVIHK